MHFNSNRKHITIFALLSCCYLILAALSISAMTKYFVDNVIQQEEENLRKNLALIRFNFEATIYKDTYLADSLATVVTIDPEFAMKNWHVIAAKLLGKAQYVRNVAIAPNNIISLVYPLKGNEAALGFDFRTQPNQLKTVLQAKEQQSVFIAGPVNLVQGGLGLIARYPIFKDYPKNTQYWGSVSVVMNYNQLLDDTGITQFPGGNIAIRKQLDTKEPEQVFYGDPSLFDDADVIYPIKLPSATWNMAAKFHIENLDRITHLRLIIVSTGTVAAFTLYMLMLLLFRNYQHTHKAALHDELTHLPNRRFIINELDRLINKNHRPTFTLLNIDLNDFKRVNDELGHEAGDELLKHIANRLVTEVGIKGSVARFGGDEFLILLYELTDRQEIETIMAHISQSIESQPFSWQSHRLIPSLSIGYAIYDGQNADIKELLSDADKRMYQQKRAYRESR
ncbi:diguanylate cyclase [Shewanella sp. JBTF-M18]|uniref:Diguanylate cyclase n=1 Tax=Shewanella insulae TaxID=2681496 RepID=A0A6L7HW87_9GAMM|nr:diguanylate cyclase [Shewanella insulae]MXR68592.1 diguanylate cyclase [Shewanella insulae]